MVSSKLLRAVATALLASSSVSAACSFEWTALTGDTCAALAAAFGITLADFIAWNPSVGTGCSVGVVPGVNYCVAGGSAASSTTSTTSSSTSVGSTLTTITTSSTTSTTSTLVSTGPSPEQTGIVSTCSSFYLVQSGDTCATIAAAKGISLANFYAWNPAVGTSCGSLWLGYYVCVDIPGVTPTTAATTTTATGPSPEQTGIISTCNKYYLVSSGDSCAVIASNEGISLANFYLWNPAVGSSCGSLWLGYYVCVGVPGTTPTTTTTATAAGPTPTQAGIVANCKTWYKAVSGDICVNIASTYGITFAQFYAWNPAVGSGCGSLWAGYYYCVGV